MTFAMPKLSGWQRIGIVVSVIWFVGFAGYVVANRQDDALYDKLLLTCAEGLQRDVALSETAKTAEEREQRRQEYGNKYSKCMNDAHVSSFRFGLSNDPLQAIPLVLAVDLGMIVIGWLIAWCVVMVFRGIRRGFT